MDTTHSVEQIRHDKVNLHRIVAHLEPLVLQDSSQADETSSANLETSIYVLQRTAKHASMLIARLQDCGEQEHSKDIEQRLLRIQQTVDKCQPVTKANRRPQSLLSALGMPRPQPIILQSGLPKSQTQEELFPSDALPIYFSHLDPGVNSGLPSTSTMESPHQDNPGLFDPEGEPTDSMGRKDTSAILSSSREMQEELAAQLAAMGRQLKLNALHLSSSLAKEQDVLENATEKLDRNLQGMTKERVRLRDHSGKSSSTTWLIFGAIMSVVVAWIGTFTAWEIAARDAVFLKMSRKTTVFFDALYTLVFPRTPISAQYADVLSSYLGSNITANNVEVAFPKEVAKNLPVIVHELMVRFRSKAAYDVYPDVASTLTVLRHRGFKLGLVSNTDSRIRDVLLDLDVARFLDVIVLSEEEGIEKPSPEIWRRACTRAGISPSHRVLHVGDELSADFVGASASGLDALLLQRAAAPCSTDPFPDDLRVVNSLAGVVQYVL